MSAVASFFKTPLTDLTGTIFTHQHYGRCRDIEMKVINCLEAYGRERGLETCSEFVDDYQECALRIKQEARRHALLQERMKQNVYEPAPREDAFHR